MGLRKPKGTVAPSAESMELRILADKAALEGRFDDYRTLHELLDAQDNAVEAEAKHEEKVEEIEDERDAAQENVEELESEVKRLTEKVDSRNTALERIQELVAQAEKDGRRTAETSGDVAKVLLDALREIDIEAGAAV